MTKTEYLDSICEGCKAFCCTEKQMDREHKCPKLKDIIKGWDAATERSWKFMRSWGNHFGDFTHEELEQKYRKYMEEES